MYISYITLESDSAPASCRDPTTAVEVQWQCDYKEHFFSLL